MGVDISYMGTKRSLAPYVRQVINRAPAGIFLDAFSGMCSVGEEVGTRRQVWSNDVQIFSSEVATALFVGKDEPPDVTRMADVHHSFFQYHKARLERTFPRSLVMERNLLSCESFESVCLIRRRLASSLRAETMLAPKKKENLFVVMYSDSYIGVEQAIDADAIVSAIKKAWEKRLISVDQRRWLTISLGRALLRVSTTTGHFAQFLTPKPNTFKRFIRQRSRSLWLEWLASIDEMEAVGSMSWRAGNRAYNKDSISLLKTFRRTSVRPRIVYADPPYTDDQYSRFYHLLETLVLYDYPKISGVGRYRAGRYATKFSLVSQASNAIEDLVYCTAKLGADLILSYPSDGLAHRAGADPLQIMRRHFKRAECCFDIRHTHSTLGASKGPANFQVNEKIYWARL